MGDIDNGGGLASTVINDLSQDYVPIWDDLNNKFIDSSLRQLSAGNVAFDTAVGVLGFNDNVTNSRIYGTTDFLGLYSTASNGIEISSGLVSVRDGMDTLRLGTNTGGVDLSFADGGQTLTFESPTLTGSGSVDLPNVSAMNGSPASVDMMVGNSLVSSRMTMASGVAGELRDSGISVNGWIGNDNNADWGLYGTTRAYLTTDSVALKNIIAVSDDNIVLKGEQGGSAFEYMKCNGGVVTFGNNNHEGKLDIVDGGAVTPFRISLRTPTGMSVDRQQDFADVAGAINTFSETNTNNTILKTGSVIGETKKSSITDDGAIVSVDNEFRVDSFFNLGNYGAEQTIVSGVITAPDTYFNIDTEADAASDDLDTINGFAVGRLLVIRANNASRTVVVKHGTGNIQLAGGVDFNLDTFNTNLVLLGTGIGWIELSRNAIP